MDLILDSDSIFKMIRYLFSIILIGSLLDAIECEMHLDKVQNNKSSFTLTLTHDKDCEIIMDEHRHKIILITKTVEDNVLELNTTEKKDTSIEKLIALAKSKLGDSYVYAAAGPDHFDCSGFVYYVFKENGITIPRTSLLQSKDSKKLNRQELKRGDILFFDTHDRGHINHSGIYLGEGKFIHSSSGKVYGVTISELDKGFYHDKFRWGIHKLP